MDENFIVSRKIVLRLLSAQNECQMYHWCTDSYSRHVASDTFLSKLREFTDKLIESYQGRYGKIDFKGEHDIKLYHVEDLNAVEFLTSLEDYLVYDPIFLNFISEANDLITFRDEMVGNINETKYKFSLKA